jgi:hypothetical protein
VAAKLFTKQVAFSRRQPHRKAARSTAGGF